MKLFELFIGIFMFFSGGSLLIFQGHDLWFRWQLQRRGIAVEGQVMRRQETRAYGKPVTYNTLTCRYIYNGQTYIETLPVSSVDFRRNVQLRLLPDSPKKASVIESGSGFAIAERVMLMGLQAFVGIYFMVVGVWLVVRPPY
jgi:Protein of unknown function (DUF3592)